MAWSRGYVALTLQKPAGNGYSKGERPFHWCARESGSVLTLFDFVRLPNEVSCLLSVKRDVCNSASSISGRLDHLDY